jgi:hypothetical protein
MSGFCLQHGCTVRPREGEYCSAHRAAGWLTTIEKRLADLENKYNSISEELSLLQDVRVSEEDIELAIQESLALAVERLGLQSQQRLPQSQPQSAVHPPVSIVASQPTGQERRESAPATRVPSRRLPVPSGQRLPQRLSQRLSQQTHNALEAAEGRTAAAASQIQPRQANANLTESASALQEAPLS